MGYALVPLVDQAQGGQLLQRIRALRRHLALQLGFLVPSIHITDNMKLSRASMWSICAASKSPAGRWIRTACWPSARTRNPRRSMESRRASRPSDVAAKWIPPGLQEKALTSGYVVVDQTSVLATHLAEIVRQFAHELLTRQETKRLLDALAETQPKLVEELVPRLLTLGEVQKVLQQLLREQVSIRDLAAILEVLLDTRRCEQIAGGAGRSGAPGALAGRWFSRCCRRTRN